MTSQDLPNPPDPSSDPSHGGGEDELPLEHARPRLRKGELPARPRGGRAHHRRRRALRLAGIVVLGLVSVGAMGIGGAEYYTSRPDFCGTCHIMDPYYNSWSQDKHGAKLGVRCVDCHYAPGEHRTFKAKFRGLSQVASYFSGRAGQGRPRAHVNDASCLTSGCHGDGEYLSKKQYIGERKVEPRVVGDKVVDVERIPTVRFAHDRHLAVDDRRKEVAQKLSSIREQLHATVAGEAFARLEKVAVSVGDVATRESEMKAALAELNLPAIEADAFEWMRLEHLHTRLDQLAGLTCAACHSYDASGKRHLSVDRQVCYTCHFTHEAFNRGTGECLRCHEAPVRQIAVHGAVSGPADRPVLMDHREIVQRGIDCVSCHRDVIQGESGVSERDCTHCHDQALYLRDFATRTTKTVAEYHRVHVAAQRARCVDCHRLIQHRLLEPTVVAGSAAVLQSVIDDCQHCHPNHHREQSELLMGVGGFGLERPMPNAMFGSRVNCRACHVQAGSDPKGDAVVQATKAACVACHGDDYQNLFDQWLHEISEALSEAESALARVDRQAAETASQGRPLPEALREKLERARTNVRLVRAGNGIHNKNYALSLLDLATRDLDAILVELSRS